MLRVSSGLVLSPNGIPDSRQTFSIGSAEVYERNFPVLVERCTLNNESGGGHGKYRGGFGAIRDYRSLSDRALLTASVGRAEFPWGLLAVLMGAQ